MAPTTFYYLVSEMVNLKATRYSHDGDAFGEASFSILMKERNKGKRSKETPIGKVCKGWGIMKEQNERPRREVSINPPPTRP